MSVSKKLKTRIAKVLYGTVRNPVFQRCPSRDIKKMHEFELEGDFSHSDDGHCCDECQCSKIAGYGTKGNFWGEGDEWHEAGHYGVGYCAEHERIYAEKFRMNTKEFAVSHRDAIMATGKLTKSDPKLVVRHQAEISKRNLKLIKNMETLQEQTDAFLQYIEDSKKKDDNVIASALEDLTEKIDGLDLDDDKAKKKLIRDIEDRVLIASSLTESAGGRIIPMTDKTKIDCIRNLIKDISKLNLDEYRMGKDAYVKIDEITVRIPKMLKVTDVTFQKIHELHLSYDQDNDNFKELLDELHDEWIAENVKLWDSLN